MVSIAESFNYRIFERKRRMGEALHESSPCMPHLSVEQQKNLRQFVLQQAAFVSVFENNKKIKRESDAWRVFTDAPRWCLLPFGLETHPLPSDCHSLLEVLNPTKIHFFGRERHTHKRLQTSFCACTNLFLFTDLSVAGLPAELKHITQRRKRKQP